MLKLLKYEFLENFLPLLIVCICFLVARVLESPFFVFVSFFALCVLQVLFVVRAFNKNLFGNFGSLLLCLPVRLDEILLAKILNCTFLITFSFVFIGFVAFYSEKSFDAFVFLHICLRPIFITFELAIITQFFLTFTLLHTFRITHFQLTLGIILFLAIGSFSIILYSYVFPADSLFYSYTGSPVSESMVYSLVKIFISLSQPVRSDEYSLFDSQSLFFLLTAIFYYFLARWLLMKKLEM